MPRPEDRECGWFHWKPDKVVSDANFKFKSTYTFHRFGLDANKIKCSIKGYGAAYDTTTERQSNQSYVYFAEENNNTDAAKKVVNYNYSISQQMESGLPDSC